MRSDTEITEGRTTEGGITEGGASTSITGGIRSHSIKGSRIRRGKIWLVLLAVLALLAAACGSDSDDDDAVSADDDAVSADDDADVAADSDADDSDADADDSEVTDEDASTLSSNADDTNGNASSEPEPTDGDEVTEDDTPVGDACSRTELATSTSTNVVVSGSADDDTEYANKYDYDLFVPDTYTGDPVPLVVNFHGLGSNGPQQAGYSGYASLAQEENFIVVHPTGLRSAQGLNSWELPQLGEDSRDDIAFTLALLEDVKKWVCIDESRIYSTGMSNGGFFSSVIACELSDVFAATFSVAGLTHPEGCNPSQPIAMGFIHGTADEVVKYLGGGSSLLDQFPLDPEEYALFEAFFEQSMPEEIAQFAADMGCDDITTSDHSDDTSLQRFDGCDDPNVEVLFYTVQDGRHVWPGGTGVTGEQTTTDFDATRDGWAFLSQFTLDSRS